MAEIVNLRQVRKGKARAANEQQAAENRVRFGRTRAEKQLEKARQDRTTRLIDSHKREEE